MAIDHAGDRESAAGEVAPLEKDPILGALLTLVLLCLLLGVVLMGLWDGVSGLVLIAAAVLVTAGLALFGLRRLGRRDALLTTLAIAVERGMPLTAAIEALADRERGPAKRRLLTLARFLDEGAPLPQALALVPGVVPRAAEFAIGVGWTSGRLAAALREAADTRGSQKSLQSGVAARLAYLATTLLLMQLIVWFVLYFVLPKHEAIFMDFGIPLPRITVIVIEVAYSMNRWGWPILLLMTIGELALAVLVPFSLAGWLPANLFGVDRLFRSRHTAPVLRALALAIEGGKPLASGVATLIRYSPAGWVRGRLELALQDLRAGDDLGRVLRYRGLIGPADAAFLEAAGRVGNLPWAMREAAEGAERRSLLHMERWSSTLFALVLLGLGASALVVATAFLTPLATLIERLAG